MGIELRLLIVMAAHRICRPFLRCDTNSANRANGSAHHRKAGNSDAPGAPTEPIVVNPAIGSKATMQVDMNAIFAPGEGRNLVFENCISSCHNYIPILQHKTNEAWEGTCIGHMVRHGVELSGRDWGALCAYQKNQL